jgi:hypothetical protein
MNEHTRRAGPWISTAVIQMSQAEIKCLGSVQKLREIKTAYCLVISQSRYLPHTSLINPY